MSGGLSHPMLTARGRHHSLPTRRRLSTAHCNQGKSRDFLPFPRAQAKRASQQPAGIAAESSCGVHDYTRPSQVIKSTELARPEYEHFGEESWRLRIFRVCTVSSVGRDAAPGTRYIGGCTCHAPWPSPTFAQQQAGIP